MHLGLVVAAGGCERMDALEVLGPIVEPVGVLFLVGRVVSTPGSDRRRRCRSAVES